MAAESQLRQLDGLRLSAADLCVETVVPDQGELLPCGVVAADAGLVSLALAPFHLELLHVSDNEGNVYLTEFFPLTTLADDLRGIFQSNPVLKAFVTRLGCEWPDLTDLWERADRNQPPMPRDIRLVADTIREIAEWAVAMELANKAPVSPLSRLVLHDGMLRSIMLRNEVISDRLPRWWHDIAWKSNGVAIAGVGKSSEIWDRLALPLSMDSRVRGQPFCYIRIPKEVEEKLSGRMGTRRLGFGHLVLLKTRSDELAQFLPVDLPEWIISDSAATQKVLASILQVSVSTFPQPGYPAPLQSAHESAHLSEFDAKILRDILVSALSRLVPPTEIEQTLRYWSFQQSKWRKAGRIGRA
ncbi:MAG: hypothetical protein K1X53_04045 [Candidatus Sumerlaeaceae bacterium]|nr:hypothetical protein [Candidatus Sumerlaeaceae bacterium]